MTLSPERRGDDQRRVLSIMASDLADTMLSGKEWPKADPRFADIAPTTRVELPEKGLIVRSPVQNEPRYLLTEAGWLAGLKINGTLDNEEFRARCVELVRYFKSLVNGRDSEWPARVHYQRLPPEPPFGWVFNVLKSGLLQRMFPDKRMNAYWEKETASVRVPTTFAMPVD